MKGTLASLAVCLGSVQIGCNKGAYAPTRPDTVSAEAIYIQGPDGKGVWNACHFSSGSDVCSIWTVSGNLLQAGIFVPYDKGEPVKQVDLQISQQGGSDVIELKNGRYLIPANGAIHDAAVRYLDFMTGKKKSFDDQEADQK